MTLTQHDQRILSLALGKTGTARARVKVSLPPDQHVTDVAVVEALVLIEKAAIRADKEGRTQEAFEMLDELMRQNPEYASGYNNRAQLRRLLNPDDDNLAMQDLNKAIELAAPKSAQDPYVSKMQAMVLRNAYLQLGAIYLEQSKTNRAESWQLQMKASEMMVEASYYGDQIAGTLAASINPFSRLCGNMMETVLKQDRM